MVTREALERYNYVPATESKDMWINSLLSIVGILVTILIVA